MDNIKLNFKYLYFPNFLNPNPFLITMTMKSIITIIMYP